jgi:hypothetical protein
MRKEFKEWMTEKDNKTKNVAVQYSAAISYISKHYSKQIKKNIDLYKKNDIDFINELVEKYEISGEYEKIGKERTGAVRAAIKAYAKYLKYKKSEHVSPIEEEHLESNKKEFERWMIDRYETTTVTSYKWAINNISRHYSQQNNERINLYTNNNIIFINGLVKDYGIGGKYQDIGDKGHGTVRCAIAAYARFLEQKRLGYDSQIGKKDLPKDDNQKSDINITQQSISTEKFEFINIVNMNILPVISFMIILPTLSKYIGKILIKRNEGNWWKKYVLEKLRETRDLPKNGSKEEYINELDISACLSIIIQNWDEIFKHEMDIHSRDLAFILLSIRNKDVAHYTAKLLSTYNYEDVDFALSTIIYFMRPIDINVAEQISEIKQEFEKKYKKLTPQNP